MDDEKVKMMMKPPESLVLYGTQDEEGAWWSTD
jgi:hypothetical protein